MSREAMRKDVREINQTGDETMANFVAEEKDQPSYSPAPYLPHRIMQKN